MVSIQKRCNLKIKSCGNFRCLPAKNKCLIARLKFQTVNALDFTKISYQTQMGNQALRARYRSDRLKKKVNPEKIEDLFVHRVACKKCTTVLSERGCKINFASQLSISGYSTDTLSEEVIEAKDFQHWKECSCLIMKIYCKTCSTECGIRVLYLCDFCQKQPTNGHNVLFLNVDGVQTPKKWSEMDHRPIPWRPFQEVLAISGVTAASIEVLKREDVTSFSQLQCINDQLLRDAGLSLGQIAKLRQFK